MFNSGSLFFAFGSGLNPCHFCYGSHAAAAAALGGDEQAIAGPIEDTETALVDNNFKPLLRYVKKLTETPSRITRLDADASDNFLAKAGTLLAEQGYESLINPGGDEAGDLLPSSLLKNPL